MREIGTVSALSDLLNSQPITARRAAEIAEESQLHLPYGTIAAYWSGKHGRPSQATLTRLSEVLKVPVATLQQAAWNATAPLGMWQPPDEAALLDQRQRDLLGDLIKSIAAIRGATNGVEATTQPTASSEAGQNQNPRAGASPALADDTEDTGIGGFVRRTREARARGSDEAGQGG